MTAETQLLTSAPHTLPPPSTLAARPHLPPPAHLEPSFVPQSPQVRPPIRTFQQGISTLLLPTSGSQHTSKLYHRISVQARRLQHHRISPHTALAIHIHLSIPRKPPINLQIQELSTRLSGQWSMGHTILLQEHRYSTKEGALQIRTPLQCNSPIQVRQVLTTALRHHPADSPRGQCSFPDLRKHWRLSESFTTCKRSLNSVN